MSNNAFGLGSRTYISWLESRNRVDNQVVRGDTRLLRGYVVNVKDHHHISQSYDVAVQDYKNESGNRIILRACKRAVDQASFDGIGEYSPLEEGDPVLLLSPNGKLEDSIIIGSTYTLGLYETYLREGQADDPFSTYDSMHGRMTAAQPSVHPSRIAQPDAYVRIVGTKNFQSPFDDPRYHVTREEQREASPQIGSIEIRNKVGDIVNYSTGSQVYYSDAEILILTNASGTSRCTRLNNMAAYYVSMVERIEKYLGVDKSDDEEKGEDNETEEPDQEQEGLEEPDDEEEAPTEIEAPTTSTPTFITGLDSNRADINSIDFNEWSPTKYHLEQAQKLAQIYREAASSCIEGSLMSNGVANAMEITDSNNVVNEDSIDAEVRQATTPICNYGKGLDTTKELIFVIHETVYSASTAIAAITQDGRGISYHGLIHRDGSVTKFISHSDSAYGSGGSSFNGEHSDLTAEQRRSSGYSQCTTSNNTIRTVNNFAIQYSLETEQNSEQRGGYTNAQYKTLAQILKSTGIKADRVTTHYNVTLTNDRTDPRHFSLTAFNRALTSIGYTGGTVNFRVSGDPIEPVQE